MDNLQEKAFWSKVDIKKNAKECWIWSGAKKPSGYGNIKVDGKYKLAHRVAFEIINGKIPTKYIVCHTCDNPSCCNPYHLMLGTTKSNAVDMLIKNRQKKFDIKNTGERNHNSKLNNEKVKQIRSLHSKGKTMKDISKMFGVSPTTIRSVILEKTWRSING